MKQRLFALAAAVVMALGLTACGGSGSSEGRTGDRFMSLCKSGQIQNCCHPNALITLQEFLADYASPETRALGQEVLKRQLLEIPNENVRAKTETYLREILQGARDFRF